MDKTNSSPSKNYFVSGSNHAGEIRGLVLAGLNVGVAAPELNVAAERELARCAGSSVKVFVDSGAFGEITFENGRPEIKREITDAEWVKRLATYERLARVLGSQLYVVAPDMVAFQTETLERLAKYADRVRAIKALGANVIVPVQKGPLSMGEFSVRATAILGISGIIWGVPMKKDATSVAELASFTASLASGSRVHLLGIGPSSGKRYEAAVAAIPAGVEVFSDSVRITALVGRGELRADGTRSPARPLTAATDAIKASGKAKNANEWKAAAVFIAIGGRTLGAALHALDRGLFRMDGQWRKSALMISPRGLPVEPVAPSVVHSRFAPGHNLPPDEARCTKKTVRGRRCGQILSPYSNRGECGIHMHARLRMGEKP